MRSTQAMPNAFFHGFINISGTINHPVEADFARWMTVLKIRNDSQKSHLESWQLG